MRMQIKIEDALDLAGRIRGRLRKEANGPELVEELKEKNPRLAQVLVDVDWIITDWGHKLARCG